MKKTKGVLILAQSMREKEERGLKETKTPKGMFHIYGRKSISTERPVGIPAFS